MDVEVPCCPICLDELTTDLVTSSCGHLLHDKCMNLLLHNNSTSSRKCPECRKPIEGIIRVFFALKTKVADNGSSWVEKASEEKLRTQCCKLLKVKMKHEGRIASLLQENAKLKQVEGNANEMKAYIEKLMDEKDALMDKLQEYEEKLETEKERTDAALVYASETKNKLAQVETVSKLSNRYDFLPAAESCNDPDALRLMIRKLGKELGQLKSEYKKLKTTKDTLQKEIELTRIDNTRLSAKVQKQKDRVNRYKQQINDKVNHVQKNSTSRKRAPLHFEIPETQDSQTEEEEENARPRPSLPKISSSSSSRKKQRPSWAQGPSFRKMNGKIVQDDSQLIKHGVDFDGKYRTITR